MPIFVKLDFRSRMAKREETNNPAIVIDRNKDVALGFKNKIRYTSYVSLENQISHIATNKSNIERQSSIYNVFSIKNITLDSKQRKDYSDLRMKTPIPKE